MSESKSELSNFDRLYFDTNALLAAGWPRLSRQLFTVVTLAKHFRVELYLPEATKLELEEHWIRDVQEKRDTLMSSLTKLNKLTGAVSSNFDIRPSFNERELRDRYKRKVYGVTRQFFKPVPFAARTVQDYFGAACRQTPPFKREGAGFQDSVIFSSLIEHLRNSPAKDAVLVSNDGIFKDARITKEIKAADLHLTVIETLDKVEEQLRHRLNERERDEWQHDQQRLADELKTQLDGIQKFIVDNLMLSPWKFDPMLRIRAVPSLKLQRFKEVRTPPLAEKREKQKAGGRVDVSFDAEVELELAVERLPSFEPPNLTVGEAQSLASTSKPLIFGFGNPLIDTIRHPCTVEVQATAKPIHDGYTDIQFVSVRLKHNPALLTPFERLLCEQASRR